MTVLFNSRLMPGTANVITRSGSQKTKLPHFCCNLFVCRNITAYFWLRVWKFGLHIATFLDYLENCTTKEKTRWAHRSLRVSYFLYVATSLFHTFCMSQHHCFILFVCRNIAISYSLYVATSLFHTLCMSQHHCFILFVCRNITVSFVCRNIIILYILYVATSYKVCTNKYFVSFARFNLEI